MLRVINLLVVSSIMIIFQIRQDRWATEFVFFQRRYCYRCTDFRRCTYDPSEMMKIHCEQSSAYFYRSPQPTPLTDDVLFVAVTIFGWVSPVTFQWSNWPIYRLVLGTNRVRSIGSFRCSPATDKCYPPRMDIDRLLDYIWKINEKSMTNDIVDNGIFKTNNVTPLLHISTLKPENVSSPFAISGGWNAGEPCPVEHVSSTANVGSAWNASEMKIYSIAKSHRSLRWNLLQLHQNLIFLMCHLR